MLFYFGCFFFVLSIVLSVDRRRMFSVTSGKKTEIGRTIVLFLVIISVGIFIIYIEKQLLFIFSLTMLIPVFIEWLDRKSIYKKFLQEETTVWYFPSFMNTGGKIPVFFL